MNLPEPQSVTFSSLFAEIEDGTIKIPQFQRDFVWSKARSAKLLDSIVKGYPIGTLILWKTVERLRSIRNLGDVKLPDTPKGDAVKYLLDGQQRLTSLYATLKGLTIQRDGYTDDFSKLWVDLKASEHDEIVVTDVTDRGEKEVIQLKELLGGDFAYLASFDKPHQEKIRKYKNNVESYQFSTVLMKDAPIDVATEVFTRLNVGGQPLSVFEIMVAKTYDAEKQFDLAEKFGEFISQLESVEYETIPAATVLQTVSVLIRKDCRKREILKLPKEDVIGIWPRAVDALQATVDYFRNFYRVPVSKLLPYPALIIPFAYFFYKHPDRPAGDQQRFLQDFFWRVGLGGRYSQSLETRVSQDVSKIDDILSGRLPKYDWAVDVSAEFIKKNGYFTVNRSFIKAVLCLFAYNEPKSFIDNSIVRLDNAYLKQSNSKNYHHFFPKSWLAGQQVEYTKANHIANITLVDDFLNKRVIKAKSPSVYMQSFLEHNKDIEKCMATHLIRLDPAFGTLQDDYARFFDARSELISEELAKRIILQPSDQATPLRSAEDTETDEEDAVAA